MKANSMHSASVGLLEPIPSAGPCTTRATHRSSQNPEEGRFASRGWRTTAKNISGPPVALLVLILILPVMLALALAVKLSSAGPIIHRRRVLGRGGRTFDAYKFRTMVVDADARLQKDANLSQAYSATCKLQNDPRVTPIGRFLRRYSLDELPQLVNVLKGEMWLIGPRMISPSELDRFGAYRAKLLTVKPGLTGLWQVSGRQTTSYERRVELDMQYIDRWSPFLDLSILFKTVRAVVSGRGAF